MPSLAKDTSNRLIGFSAVETFRVEAATAPVFQMPLFFDLVFFGMEEHAEKLFVAMQVGVLGAGDNASNFSNVTLCVQLSPKS